MRLNVQFFTLIFFVTVAISGCEKAKANSTDHGDVTADFLSKTGNHKYLMGTKKVDVGEYEVAISEDGTLKIKYSDPQCPFVIYGKLDKVIRESDGRSMAFAITYSQTSAELDSSVTDNKECQKEISDYRYNNIPQTITKIACGYTFGYVDFACNGNVNSSTNWTLKR